MSPRAQQKVYAETPFNKLKNLNEFNKQVITFDYKVGDHVRLVNTRTLFEKSSNFRRWSEQIYQVTEVWATNPPTYVVEQVTRGPSDGRENRRQYKWEMQRVYPPPHNETKAKEVEEQAEKQAEDVQVSPVPKQRKKRVKGLAPERVSTREKKPRTL
jgi:hypothetical protein